MCQDCYVDARDLIRLKSGRDWHGFLTLENFDAVAERVRAMLGGRHYTWVACNEGHGEYFPEIRLHQRAEKIVGTRKVLDGGRDWAHLLVCDTYGVWGVDTDVPDQKTAYGRCKEAHERGGQEGRHLTHLNFTRGRYDAGRIEIEHFAPAGSRLYWVITVEQGEDDA